MKNNVSFVPEVSHNQPVVKIIGTYYNNINEPPLF